MMYSVIFLKKLSNLKLKTTTEYIVNLLNENMQRMDSTKMWNGDNETDNK